MFTMGSSKRSGRLRQIAVLIFLFLVVLGFTVPIILYSPDDPLAKKNSATIEPRSCLSDTDCSLTCDDTVQQVICLTNVCMQNSCDEYPTYPYVAAPLEFSLSISINETKQNLSTFVNSADSFVAVSSDTVSVFTNGLTLPDIASKVGFYLYNGCLYSMTGVFCPSAGTGNSSVGTTTLTVLINGNASMSAEKYVPGFGDSIEIVYG